MIKQAAMALGIILICTIAGTAILTSLLALIANAGCQ